MKGFFYKELNQISYDIIYFLRIDNINRHLILETWKYTKIMQLLTSFECIALKLLCFSHFVNG